MHPGYAIGSVYLHRDPIDFRKQINGLAALVQGELELSPFMDAVFVFTNCGRTSLKVLYWHRNGFCLWQKRLETNRFAWPKGGSFDRAHQVSVSEFQWLLEGLDPSAANKIELAIEAMIQAQVEQRIQAEIDRKIQSELARFIQEEKARQDAQFDQRVAHEVVQKVLEIIEQNRLARHRQFGASSETYQGTLFNEAESLADQSPGEDDESCANQALAENTPDTSSRKNKPRARGHRGPLPPELPRVEVLIDVPQDQRMDARGQPMVRIGEEVSEQLDIIPMKIRVLRTVRPKYATARGDGKPVIASPPASLLPRSILSAGAMAMVIAVKFVDGLPLFRTTKVLARGGIHLPPQTLARNCIKTAQALQPLYNLLQDSLFDGSIIHMDETHVQVLNEPERKATTESYMWVRRGGPPGKTVVLFDYEQNRSGKTPTLLLEGWRGHLMTDCYSGYNAMSPQPGVVRMACMAHARREFVKADRANPSQKDTPAKQAIRFFARLIASRNVCAMRPIASVTGYVSD